VARIRAVILDFDGVLAESNKVKDAAFDEFFNRYPEHAAAMRAYHLDHHAAPRRLKFRYLADELMRESDVDAAVDSMAEAFTDLVAERVIACPEVAGASAFLAEFSERIPLYISSVTPQEELDRIIAARGVAPHIRRAYGNPPYPKNEAIRTILDLETLGSDQVAFVGDSGSDFLVARETGLEFLGRDSGQPFPAEAVDLELAADMTEIAERLRPLL